MIFQFLLDIAALNPMTIFFTSPRDSIDEVSMVQFLCIPVVAFMRAPIFMLTFLYTIDYTETRKKWAEMPQAPRRTGT